MASTAAQWQSRILLEVGAGLEGSDELDLLTPSIAGLWDAWAAQAYGGPYLQYLYTKRQAVDVLLGQLRGKVNNSLGPLAVSLNQKFTNLQKLRDNVTADIVAFMKLMQANRPAVIGTIRQTAPIMPDPLVPNQPDPNSRRYRGDPLLAPTDADVLGVPATGG